MTDYLHAHFHSLVRSFWTNKPKTGRKIGGSSVLLDPQAKDGPKKKLTFSWIQPVTIGNRRVVIRHLRDKGFPFGVRGYRWGLLFHAQESLTATMATPPCGTRWRDSVVQPDPDPSACNSSGRHLNLVPCGGGNQRYVDTGQMQDIKACGLVRCGVIDRTMRVLLFTIGAKPSQGRWRKQPRKSDIPASSSAISCGNHYVSRAVAGAKARTAPLARHTQVQTQTQIQIRTHEHTNTRTTRTHTHTRTRAHTHTHKHTHTDTRAH